jgi:hypothetical protein
MQLSIGINHSMIEDPELFVTLSWAFSGCAYRNSLGPSLPFNFS